MKIDKSVRDIKYICDICKKDILPAYNGLDTNSTFTLNLPCSVGRVGICQDFCEKCGMKVSEYIKTLIELG